MMPFSILRPFTLGILSWAILGTGIYCLWEWSDGIDPPRENEPVVATDNNPGAIERTAVGTDVVEERDTQGGWPYLAWGLGLISLSIGGFVPVLVFLGKPKIDEPKAVRNGAPQTIARPDGSILHVEVYGPDDATTLILTHGWSLDSTAWYYAKRDLASRYRLVVWDLPGMGLSKGPANRDYSLEKMARDLDAVITETSNGQPVILVSHSIGGMLTQTFCRLFPNSLSVRVAGIVLLYTTYTNPLNTALGASLWKAIEKPILVPLNHLAVWMAPLVWLSNWQSYLNGSLHMATRFASFAGNQTWGQVDYGAWLAAKAWPGAVARGNLAMVEFDEQKTLPNVDLPVLVIAADHDRMTKPEASERIDQLLPHSVLTTIRPAGHLGYWEQQAQVHEAISEFADKYARRAPALAAVRDQESSASTPESAHGRL